MELQVGQVGAHKSLALMCQSRKKLSQSTPKGFTKLPVRRKLVSVQGYSCFCLTSTGTADFIARTLAKRWKPLVTVLGQYMQGFSEIQYSFMSLQLSSRDGKIISVQSGSTSGASEPREAFLDGNHSLCLPVMCMTEEPGTRSN